MELKVKTILKSPLWKNKGETFAYGYGIASTGLMTADALAAYFFEIKNEKDFVSAIKRIDGIYAVMTRLPDNRFLISSGICGIPQLFYRIDEPTSEINISDNAYILCGNNFKLNEKAAWLYRCLGYIPGDETLAENIQRIEPAKYLVIQGDIAIQKEFHSYLCNKDECNAQNKEQLESCFIKILNRVFDRMITIAAGRQIAIPLSSGCDSRLIAAMLKSKGYDNVICYTIGTQSNSEITIAKNIAESLGFQHYTIYSENEYIDLDSDDINYLAYCCNLCNMPWTFEYPAVKHLLQNKIITDDALFAPGHSGDFLGGSHTRTTLTSTTSSLESMARKIASYRAIKKGDKTATNFVLQQLQDKKAWLATSVFDDYTLKNWLPRNINVSCRLYGYFGHEVLLPFWDKEMLRFFKTLPTELKNEECFYTDCIRKYVFRPAGVDFSINEPPTKTTYRLQLQKDFIKSVLPASLLKFILPEQKSSTGLQYINRQMEAEILGMKPKLYSNMHNEKSLLWYLAKLDDNRKNFIKKAATTT